MLRVREHDAEERSHYSSGTSDIEYLYPIGWPELEGVANRGDFDLTQHTELSGTKLEYVGQDGERYIADVIEPAVSVERIFVAMLVEAYDEEVVGERERTVLHLHPADRTGEGGDPAADRRRATSMVVEGARALRGAAPPPQRRVRRQRRRSAGATAARTRSARRGRSRSTSRRSWTTPSPSATATRSRRSGCRSRACAAWLDDALAARLDEPKPDLDAALHHTLRRCVEADLAVERVRVARVQHPTDVLQRPALDHLAHELGAEAAAAVLGQHVDVREVDERDAVAEGAREPDLPVTVVETDDALRLTDQPLDVSRGRPSAQYDLFAR